MQFAVAILAQAPQVLDSVRHAWIGNVFLLMMSDSILNAEARSLASTAVLYGTLAANLALTTRN